MKGKEREWEGGVLIAFVEQIVNALPCHSRLPQLFMVQTLALPTAQEFVPIFDNGWREP